MPCNSKSTLVRISKCLRLCINTPNPLNPIIKFCFDCISEPISKSKQLQQPSTSPLDPQFMPPSISLENYSQVSCKIQIY